MQETLQHKLRHLRPPRVKITYDSESGGAIVRKEAPFIIGVLADICARPSQALPTGQHRKFIEVNRNNFDKKLNKLLHHEQSEPLEPHLRELRDLVMNTETSSRLKIKVLSASKTDLIEGFSAEKCTEQDGTAFSLLIGDYTFGDSAVDKQCLNKISKIATHLHAPFISVGDTANLSFLYLLPERNAAYPLAQRISHAIALYSWPATLKAEPLLSEEDSSSLASLLCAARFIQTMKVILREQQEALANRKTIEDYLNNWIASYVLLDDAASQHVQALYPLKSAQICVADIIESPGAYQITLAVNPRFQFENLSNSIKLTLEYRPNQPRF